VAIIISLVAIGLAIATFVGLSNVTAAQSYVTSGPIRPSPYTIFLDSTAAPIAMTLPNDLSSYNVGEEYTVLSRSAQPHTITIEAGALGTTWDGVNKVATFGGAKGDGLIFHVLAKDLVQVTFVNNVAFS